MDASPHPDLPQLPRELYYLVVHALCGALPPPVTDAPEDLARRNHAIIAAVASLRPANTAEVLLAAQCVAAGVQALDCLRLCHRFVSGCVRLVQDDRKPLLKPRSFSCLLAPACQDVPH
jgi:hypothetical protein